MTGSAKKDTDTVRAMLTPGEAVLTVAAAERVGRKNIAMLNKTAKKPEKPKPRKYADGTDNVTPMDPPGANGESWYFRPGITDKEISTAGRNIGMAEGKQAAQRGRDAYNAANASGPHYAKGTAKVPQPRMSKVDRVVDRLFKK